LACYLITKFQNNTTFTKKIRLVVALGGLVVDVVEVVVAEVLVDLVVEVRVVVEVVVVGKI
jgi:hypothetical protein